MTTPPDRNGFDDRADDGSWHEPAHLSGDEDATDQPNFTDRRRQPRDDDAATHRAGWEPAGWNLPDAAPDRTRDPSDSGNDSGYAGPPVDQPGASVPPGVPPPVIERPGWGSPPRGEVGRVFAYQGDLVGAQSWALHHGWSISDGSGPEDAVLQQLVASAPVRPSKDHRPGGVMRGRAGTLELVAFDVVYPMGRSFVPQWAVTAAPVLTPLPGIRLSPARFWRHRTGSLVPVVSGNEAFDTRWLLLAAEDGPQVRRLVQDPTVQGLLLGSDDGDEFWSAAGHVAAIRPDGHRPQLIEHHARLLAALVGALSAGW
jgi:hypothetical protein